MIGDRAEGFVEIVLCHQLRLAKGKRVAHLLPVAVDENQRFDAAHYLKLTMPRRSAWSSPKSRAASMPLRWLSLVPIWVESVSSAGGIF